MDSQHIIQVAEIVEDNQPVVHNQNGELVKPEFIKAIYVEPAIKWKVRQKSYFYEKAPLSRKDDYEDDEIAEESEIAPEYKVTLITRTKKNSNQATENLVAFSQLDANTNVLVRPFEYEDPDDNNRKKIHPYLKQVATYKSVGSKDPNLPESGSEIEVQHLGYMYDSDLEPGDETFEERVSGEEEKLFPHRPCLDDIKQAGMGDCFFLSSLQAILAKGEEGVKFIENMMVDQGDGTVLVRLFDPRTGAPVFVKVRKSVHCKNGHEEINHEALWVHILEKAYAGFAFKEFSSKEKHQSFANDPFIISHSSLLGMYGGGGQELVALRVLTGETANRIPFNNKSETANPLGYDSQQILFAKMNKLLAAEIMTSTVLLQQMDDLAKDPNNYEHMEKIALAVAKIEESKLDWLDKYVQKTGCYNALAKDRELTKRWGVYIFIVSFFFPNAAKALSDLNKFQLHQRDEILAAIAKLKNLVPPPPDELIDLFAEYVNEQKEVDGKMCYNVHGAALSGEYTHSEYKLFNELKAAHDAGHCLTAATLTKFDGILGLRNKHAYTITDVFTKNVSGHDIMFVRLRNPWGKVGRVYDENGIPQEDRAAAEFDLDIRDFVSYYNNYTVGSILPANDLNNKVTAENQRLAAIHNKTFQVPFEKLDDNGQYDLITKLVALEVADRNTFLTEQSVRGLFELWRSLNEEIAYMERSLISRPAQQIQLLPAINARRQLMNELNKFMKQNNYQAFGGAVHKQQYFSKESIRRFETHEAEFRKGFRSLAVADAAATKTSRENFVFRIISQPNSNNYLKVQSMADLSELIKFLKTSIPQKKQHLKSIKNKQIKAMATRHLEAHEELLEKVETLFKVRLQTSSSYAAIQANAKAYINNKKKNSLWYAFKRPFKSFFNSDSEEKSMFKTYKRHLKYVASQQQAMTAARPPLDAEGLLLATEYLIGKPYGPTGRTHFGRASDLTIAQHDGLQKISAGEIQRIEIIDTGVNNKYELHIYTLNKSRGEHAIVVQNIDGTTIQEYAQAQAQYRTREFAEMNTSDEKEHRDSSIRVSEFLKYDVHAKDKLDLRVLPVPLARMIQTNGHENIASFSVAVNDNGTDATISITLKEGVEAHDHPMQCTVTIRELENLALEANEYNKHTARSALQEMSKAARTAVNLKFIIEEQRHQITDLALEYFLLADRKNLPNDLQNFLSENKRMKHTWTIIKVAEGYQLQSTRNRLPGVNIDATQKFKLTTAQVEQYAIAQFESREATLISQIKRLHLDIGELSAKQLQNNKHSQLRYIVKPDVESVVKSDDVVEEKINKKGETITIITDCNYAVRYRDGSTSILKLPIHEVERLAVLQFEHNMKHEDYFRENVGRFRIS